MKLSYGTTFINLDEPDFPYAYAWDRKQTMLETEQGQRYVYTFGAKRRRWDLRWSFLPASQFQALENFITNTVNFKELPFTFVDHRGNNYTVRCIAFSFSQVNPYYYSVSLVLEEEVL